MCCYRGIRTAIAQAYDRFVAWLQTLMHRCTVIVQLVQLAVAIETVKQESTDTHADVVSLSQSIQQAFEAQTKLLNQLLVREIILRPTDVFVLSQLCLRIVDMAV